MTQEDKELLLKDISARLPYGVKITIDDDIPIILNQISYNDGYVGGNNECYSLEHFVIKPYLFPMSSMTEEQEIEYGSLLESDINGICYDTAESIDWLNKNHFDFRGLIEKGLAIDATGKNIY